MYKNCIKLKLISNILREVNFAVRVTSAKISKFLGRKNKVSLVLPESFCILRSFCPNLLQAIKILIEVNIIYHTLWSCLRRIYWLKYSCCVLRKASVASVELLCYLVLDVEIFFRHASSEGRENFKHQRTTTKSLGWYIGPPL